ncbi:PDZ domain-containing protein [Clostridium sp.]|uniref:PDZ domain-containing protein n=1 Tax=Clostridium sp. TaxID=1506 RepID=UPI002913B409|nr:PDZ domain-containing protein [Clostridium sp.]MDU3408342.1 site-2 protease family protein [Clostridium sp.]
MELILYTLRTVAYAIIEPMHILMLVVLGIMFYLKNKRITIMQKMTIGESINSPLELTLSQISLGIIGGVIVSLMMSSLGIIFNENSGIEIMFMISILLLFIKKRFICFSYSGAVLGMISILSGILSNITNTESYINVNILSLMTFVGIMHVVEGVLVIFDGGRGAIPVFSNRNDKIVGGFAYNRYWALPVAIFIAFSGSISSVTTSVVDTPNWWPIINRAETLLILSTAIIGAIPLYGVIGYNSVSFTKDKIKKPIYSGVGILIYGVLLTLIAQVSQFGVVGQIVVIAFAPLGHEIMIRIQNKIEEAGKYIYVTDNDGVSVLEVSLTSPAYEAGIRRGDKIIEVNNVKTVSEVEIFKIVRDSIEEISFKIRRISGEMLDLTIIPKNKRLGLLLVPKMVKVDDALSVDNDDFKKVLEQMKRKR